MKCLILAVIIALGINTVADAAQYVIRYQNGKWDVIVLPDNPYSVYPSPYVYSSPYYLTPYYYPTLQPCPHYHKPKPKSRHHKSCDRYWPTEHM